MDIRDWMVRGAGRPIGTLEGAVAALNEFGPEGNWSVEQEDGQWYLFTGDQWVGRADDETEFAAFVAGVAVAIVTSPKAP